MCLSMGTSLPQIVRRGIFLVPGSEKCVRAIQTLKYRVASAADNNASQYSQRSTLGLDTVSQFPNLSGESGRLGSRSRACSLVPSLNSPSPVNALPTLHHSHNILNLVPSSHCQAPHSLAYPPSFHFHHHSPSRPLRGMRADDYGQVGTLLLLRPRLKL